MHYLCACDCGTQREVSILRLTENRSQSCGCALAETIRARNHDRCVQRWSGRVLSSGVRVIAPARRRGPGAKHRYWKCQCPCGKPFLASLYDVSHSRKTHCGCKLPPVARKDSRLLWYQGRQVTCTELGRLAGVHRQTIQARILVYGMTPEEAVAVGRDRGAIARRRPDPRIGERYGRLTVQAFVGYNVSRHRCYRCVCDCGGECPKVPIGRLRTRVHPTRSCGCLRAEKSVANLAKGKGPKPRAVTPAPPRPPAPPSLPPAPTRLRPAEQTTPLRGLDDRDLIARYQAGDSAAGMALVERNAPAIKAWAQKVPRRGVDFEDVLQEARIGFLRGVAKFDLVRPNKLFTYARMWVLQAVQRYVRAQAGDIRVPDHRQIKRQMGPMFAARLDAPLGEDEGRTLHDLLPGATELPEQTLLDASWQKQVRGVLRRVRLTPRERTIVDQMVMTDAPKMAHEVGADFGITKQRASQIKLAALRKIRTAFTRAGVGMDLLTQ